MEEEENLYDSKELSRDMLTGMRQAFQGDAPGAVSEKVVDELQVLLEPYLRQYNEKYRQLRDKLDNTRKELEETRASHAAEIEALKQGEQDRMDEVRAAYAAQIEALKEGEKDRTEDEVRRAVFAFREQRDSVTKIAEQEREDLEKEKTILHDTRWETQSQMEKLRRQAQQAEQEKAESFRLLEEKQQVVGGLEGKVQVLEGKLEDARGEVKGWRDETYVTLSLKEEAKRQRDAIRSEMQRIRDRNEAIERNLGEKERGLEKTIAQQEARLAELKFQLAEAEESLKQKNLLEARPGFPSAGLPPVTPYTPYGRLAADELSYLSRSQTGSTRSLMTLASSVYQPTQPTEDQEKQIRELEDEVSVQQDRIRDLEEQLGIQEGKTSDPISRPSTAATVVKASPPTDPRKEGEGGELPIKILSDELARARKRLEDLEDEVKYYRKELDIVNENHSTALDTIARLKEAAPSASVIEKYEEEAASARDHLQKVIEGYEEEAASARDQLQKAEAALEESKNKAAEVEQKYLAEAQAGREQTKAQDQELKQANQKLTAYAAEHGRLRDEVGRLEAVIRTMRNTLNDQARIMDNQSKLIERNAHEAQQMRQALDEQLVALNTAQRALGQSIAQAAVSPGRSAADTGRALRTARREMERLKERIQTLKVQCEQWEDMMRGSVEKNQEARQRAREAAAAAAAQQPEEAAGSGARPRDYGTGDARGFFARTYDLFLTVSRYSLVWGTIAFMFTVMVGVIVAEGRQLALWRHSNVESRAMLMALGDRPTVCLPTDYGWYAIGLLLLGRWLFLRLHADTSVPDTAKAPESPGLD